MPVDVAAAVSFVTTHARMLDRRRLALLLGAGDPTATVAALDAYRNPDGGYGWGLEPDLRAGESQPGGALHAFEVFEELGAATSPQAVQLCDWLAAVSNDDDGMAFALPVTDPAGCAPFWLQPDQASSLHITAAVAAAAARVGRHDVGVARHPWLAGAITFCLGAIDAHTDDWHALELRYAIDFLDAVSDGHPEVIDRLDRLGKRLPADGLVHVGGGRDDEFMRALDFAPLPERPSRKYVAPDVVAAELERLAGRQTPDGGWPDEFDSYSPAATLEWRGYLTVHAISLLLRNGVPVRPN